MKTTETTATSKELFSGKILHMFHDEVILPDGGRAMREIVRHPGGVCIAALDDENNLFFVRQFRYPYKEEVLELPAGKLEKGMTPLENGKRELLDIQIDPKVVDPDDVEMLQDLIMAAVNEALRKGEENREATMNKMAPGMGGMGGLF